MHSPISIECYYSPLPHNARFWHIYVISLDIYAIDQHESVHLQAVDDQHRKPTKPPPMTNSLFSWPATRWASYQIRKIAGCACAGNVGNVFPATNFKGNRWFTIAACIMERASCSAVMHVGMANLRWRGKRSRHSPRMRNPQFYVSDKRPMGYRLKRAMKNTQRKNR